MLGCFLLKKFEKFIESSSMLKADRMSSTHLKFTIENKFNHSILFLDVFISGINNENPTLQTNHKSTNTGFL